MEIKDPSWMQGEPEESEPYNLNGWPPASVNDEPLMAWCYKCIIRNLHVAGQCVDCREYRKEQK
jgi:hypothetical protein